METTHQFLLTNDPNGVNTFHIFSKTPFNYLTFTDLIVEGATAQLIVNLSQTNFDAQSSESELLPFDQFKKKYLEESTQIFVCGGMGLMLALGIIENGRFISLSDSSFFNFGGTPNNRLRDYKTIKDFKIRFSYKTKLEDEPVFFGNRL